MKTTAKERKERVIARKLRAVATSDGTYVSWKDSDNQDRWIRIAKHVLKHGYR